MGNCNKAQQKLAIDPDSKTLANFDTFDCFVDQLNHVSELNAAFLKSQLNIEALQVQLVKPKRNAISKIWTNKLMESSVVCTYTILSPTALPTTQSLQSLIDDCEDDTFEVVRQFRNLRSFILEVGQVFQTLDRLAAENRKFQSNLEIYRKHA